MSYNESQEEYDIHQTIYDHGGSRIWVERKGKRDLLVDTYGDKELAQAVMDCVKKLFRPNKKQIASPGE